MTEIENKENASHAPQDGALNKTEEKGERMFTQSQLEEILSQRMSRERKVNESLSSVKSLLKTAVERGLIKGSSYAEMAEELASKLRGDSGKEKAQSTEEKAETSPSQTEENATPAAEGEAENNACNKCGNDGVKKEKENENDGEGFTAFLSGIKTKYPKKELEKLFDGDLFERFAKGRSGNPMEIVDDFLGFMGSAGSRDEQNVHGGGHSSFASTAFSSQSGVPENSTNLTKQQMEMAKSAGLSYREYAEMLESIPKRTGRTI